ATTEPLPYDPGPIPDCLRRTAPSGGNGAPVPNDVDAVYEELSARGDLPPWRPRGRGWHLMEDLPRQEAGTTGFLKEPWVPPLSSGPDDDVFDLDPGWRQ